MRGIVIVDGVCYTGCDDWRYKRLSPSKLHRRARYSKRKTKRT